MFCADYGNIPSALYLATRNYQTRPVTLVIPGNHDLFQFFQAVNERVFQNTINLIYFESYPARRVSAKGLNKVFHTSSDIVGERRYLKETWEWFCAHHDEYLRRKNYFKEG